MTDEARKARVSDRASGILARQPSAAEVAADEARRAANRIDRIMAPAAAATVQKEASPVHYRRQDDALIEHTPPSLERPAVARSMTSDERKRAWFDIIDRLMVERIAPDCRRQRPSDAIQWALIEMAAGFMAAAERADKLEARLAALEAGSTKPRHRVPAGRRTTP